MAKYILPLILIGVILSSLFSYSKADIVGEIDELRYLLDVNQTSASNGQVLTYNSSQSKWINSNPAGNVSSTITISTTSPLTGGGDLSANRTIAIPKATSSVDGYLNATNWSTFNSKADYSFGSNNFNGTGNFTTTNNITSGDFKIPSQSLGTPTYSTVNDFTNSFGSAGRKTGGVMTDGGSGNISVTAGTGFIKATDDDNAQLLFFNFPANTNITIPANTTRYIGVEYNSGTPQLVARTSWNWNLDSEFPLGRVINEYINSTATLHIINNPWWVTDGMTNIIERFRGYGRITRDNNVGGMIPSVTGTRNVVITAGTLWSNLNEFPIAAIDTSGTDTIEYYWYNATSGWTRTDSTQFSVTQWNDVTQSTLQTIDNNKFCNVWIYAEADDSKYALLYPQAQYNTAAAAEAVGAPTLVPEHISQNGILIGRFIIKQNTNTPIAVQSAFATTFSASVVTDHGNLSSLADDDHTQYWIVNGTRTGNLTATGTVNATTGIFANITDSGNLNLTATSPIINVTAGTVLKPATDTTTAFQIQNSTGTSLMNFDTTNGRVGIGTSSPEGILHISANAGNIYTDANANDNNAAGWFVRKKRAGSIVQSGDAILALYGQGYDGSAYRYAGVVGVEVDGTPGSGDMPGRIVFLTTPDGSPSLAERMRINNAGNVGIGTTSPSVKLHLYDASPTTSNMQNFQMLSDTYQPTINYIKERASGANVQNGDGIGKFEWTPRFNSIITQEVAKFGAYYTGNGTTRYGELYFSTSDGSPAADRLRIGSGGNIYIADSANAKATQGLTINQAGNDDEILSLKSSDVSHSFTDDTEADSYGIFYKPSAANGGLRIMGYTDGDAEGALTLGGSIGASNPTDTNAAVVIQGNRLSGTGRAALGDSELAIRFRNYSTNLMQILGSGYVGIRTTGPDRALEINENSGNCLRLTYNDANGSAANYADFLVSSSGDLTVSASGGDISFDNENLVTTGTLGAGATTVTTLNTGQGAYELYAMNQNVQTADDVTFKNITASALTVDNNIVNLSDTTDEYVLAFDTTTNTWRGVPGGGSGATTALDNLASVAINTDLLSDAADTDSLGSTSKEWLNAYLGDAGKLYFGLGQDGSINRSAANTLTITASTATIVTGDLYTVGWTDYFASSSITGWTTPSGNIRYIKIGKTVFVQFVLTGTSNSVSVSFTLPYQNNGGNEIDTWALAYDNGAIQTLPSRINMDNGSATVTTTKAYGVDWTGSGTKTSKGQFWYRTSS